MICCADIFLTALRKEQILRDGIYFVKKTSSEFTFQPRTTPCSIYGQRCHAVLDTLRDECRSASTTICVTITCSRLPHLKYKHTFENDLVRDLCECDHILEYVVSTAALGRSLSPESSWNDAVFATISSARFCQDRTSRRFHATLQISTCIHHRTGSR